MENVSVNVSRLKSWKVGLLDSWKGKALKAENRETKSFVGF